MKIETTEDRIALFGSEIQQYINLSGIQTDQLSLQNTYEIYREAQLSKINCIELKEFYNREFDKLWTIKIKDIDNIKEQNQRLRHIQSEINYFETSDNLIEITDPILTHYENPETIKTVNDDEISAKPSIRHDEIVNLEGDEKIIDENEIVQFDDGFYGDAIETTMKSVLETRWEDELKKDIPLPDFLATKQSREYREDDRRRALEEYEEKRRILNDERERYKQLLKIEFTKIQQNIDQTTEKFNYKLKKLYLLQLKMKSIENQEQLKFEYLKFNYKQLKDHRDYIEYKLIEQIKNLNIAIEDLEEFLINVQEIIENDCRKLIKDLQNREKILQEAFKRDIQEFSSVIQEYAIRIYKKRPKVVVRNLNSTTILNQLAKSVESHEILPTYNPECVEFLNSLDNLDLFIGTPPGVDENTFNLICKHRRLRIEFEFNWKAVQINSTESQSTFNQLQRELLVKKRRLEELQNNLVESNENYIETKLNTPIQLIVQHGLVELKQTGDLNDFNDAVLIQRNDIDEINEIILKFGNRKLKQLQLGMVYDKRILLAEWKHQYMKMTIEDFQEKIKDIGAIKMTKTLQNYLDNKQDRVNLVDDEIKLIRITFDNLIKQQRDIVEKLQKQIKVLKEKNQKLDKQIGEINIDVCDYNLQKDQQLQVKVKNVVQSRMSIFIKRSNLIKQIQQNHTEMLILQAELELRRLAVYPTLPYRVIE